MPLRRSGSHSPYPRPRSIKATKKPALKKTKTATSPNFRLLTIQSILKHNTTSITRLVQVK